MNFKPFYDQAKIQIMTDKVFPSVNEAEISKILLWKAYLKRIRPVPAPVLADATNAFLNAAAKVNVKFGSAEQAQMVMDRVGDLLWPKDEHESREWLLKVK